MGWCVADAIKEAKEKGIEIDPIDVFIWRIAEAHSIEELDTIRKEVDNSKLDIINKTRLNCVNTIKYTSIRYKEMLEEYANV